MPGYTYEFNISYISSQHANNRTSYTYKKNPILPSGCILRKTTQILHGLTSNIPHRLCLLVVFLAGTSYTASSGRRLMQSGVVIARGRAFKASRADVDGSLVSRLPVACGWGLVRQRQVRLVLIDFFALVGFIVVDGLMKLVYSVIFVV